MALSEEDISLPYTPNEQFIGRQNGQPTEDDSPDAIVGLKFLVADRPKVWVLIRANYGFMRLPFDIEGNDRWDNQNRNYIVVRKREIDMFDQHDVCLELTAALQQQNYNASEVLNGMKKTLASIM